MSDRTRERERSSENTSVQTLRDYFIRNGLDGFVKLKDGSFVSVREFLVRSGDDANSEVVIHHANPATTEEKLLIQQYWLQSSTQVRLVQRRRVRVVAGIGATGHAIASAPGAWMSTLAGAVFSPRTKERIFDQIVADFREEYFNALQARAGGSRLFFVVARHWIGFIIACVMEAGTGIAKVWKMIRGTG